MKANSQIDARNFLGGIYNNLSYNPPDKIKTDMNHIVSSGYNTTDSFMHNVEKWPNTARFLYVWPFDNVMHEKVNTLISFSNTKKTVK